MIRARDAAMSDIDAHYKNSKAVLWVEDSDTRTWLDAVWLGSAPTIRILVAGSYGSVKIVCEQARLEGHRHVFGMTDSDFGSTNRPRWGSLDSKERVYRLDVHEFENLLLDPSALFECKLNTAKRPLADIDARIAAAATSRAWWVACVRFLAETQQAAKEGYPPPPPPSINSLTDAERHVCESLWFASTAATCSSLAAPTAVTTGLQDAYNRALAALADGTWRQSFPGKEIFQEIGAYVQPGAKGPAGRMDLIKAIGAWQRANGVPSQVSEIRTHILARV